jgi:Tol biopolymer transport system component
MSGLAWTRDGRSIVYGATGGGLWRVRVDGSAPPERVELAGREASGPSTAITRDRLAFNRGVWDPDIYHLQPGRPPALLIGSAFADWNSQYSPDGQRIAFESARTGGTGEEIWLAEADGSSPTRLTRGPGVHQGSPRWSPDGRSIVFDSRAENGLVDIWVIGADGSRLRQVTHGPADGIVPSWSRDGRFIYFSSNRTGRYEVWRVPAAGGADEQVTREGGVTPFESLDGRTLYYLQGESSGPLVARPAAGGEERTVVGCVAGGVTWAVVPRGLFYVACGSPNAPVSLQHTLRYWDAVTGQDRPVATLESDGIWGLSVSPDGQSILYGRGSWTSDLMMVENFR